MANPGVCKMNFWTQKTPISFSTLTSAQLRLPSSLKNLPRTPPADSPQPLTFCSSPKRPHLTLLLPLTRPLPFLRLFHSSPASWRSGKIKLEQVFDSKKIQKTMNKVMGVRGPVKKVAYVPGTQGLKHRTTAALVKAQDFKVLTLSDRPVDSVRKGPSPGNVKRAKQLSDVLFLRITEMIHSGDVHPIFRDHSIDISRVELGADMRNLTIYWSLTPHPDRNAEIGKLLNEEAAWDIRSQLAGLQVLGRSPTIRFVGDDSKLRLNQLHRLIQEAEKPPEDEDDESRLQDADVIKNRDEDERAAPIFPELRSSPDAPTWSEVLATTRLRSDALGLDRNAIMLEVEKGMKARRGGWDGREEVTASPVSSSGSPPGVLWRLESTSKHELARFLKDRKRKLGKSTKPRLEFYDDDREDDDDDRYDDADTDDDHYAVERW